MDLNKKKIAIIVAHPDDEILWAGGTILNHPDCSWFIVCLCRGDDPDRSKKFYETLKILNADGIMGTLDDSPELAIINPFVLQQTILNLLPSLSYDLIITHNENGEYSTHIRHNEISTAVILLWNSYRIISTKLWTFAYEDGCKRYLPRPTLHASHIEVLSNEVWEKKYRIMTETYGYETYSWEAKTTPKVEAYWNIKRTGSLNKSE